jgi:uncharacterized BrkB/YihY/UPF0761 family membrane protein
VDNDQKLRSITRRTRRRLLFSLVTLVLYFSYIFNYTSSNTRLGARIGESHITGSLVMFALLILVFLGLELLFLFLNRRQERSE